ncbi:MAG TPA: hypothetical protein VFR31_21155, partial [Thermoanaerobaculia bacterium]|nr:hypothetical protein [Thermoanaerobaculia bacterium]
EGVDVHTLRVPAITRLQEDYIRKVVETVGDLGVLWEISNESPGESRDWQYHLIRFLKTLSPFPVGMTSCFPRGRNEDLFSSPADWISPNHRGGWKRNPPPADGSKVVILDTDHLWGIGGDRAWIWKSFLAGHHPIYMDPLDSDPRHEDARRAMGSTRRLAERLDLARMSETVFYLPRGRGKIPFEGEAEWIDPGTGVVIPAWVGRRVKAPFPGDAVLYLKSSATDRATSS